MQWSRLLSALAFSAVAVSAKRSLRHMGPLGERLQAKTIQREPQIRNEYLPVARRASTDTYQFLTNKTECETGTLTPSAASIWILLTCLTQAYLVDGTAIPDVEFDVGESYSGSLPLNGTDSDDELFFWFFPSTNAAADGEILIWLNGGVSLSHHKKKLTIICLHNDSWWLTFIYSSPDVHRSRVFSRKTDLSCGRMELLLQSRTLTAGTDWRTSFISTSQWVRVSLRAPPLPRTRSMLPTSSRDSGRTLSIPLALRITKCTSPERVMPACTCHILQAAVSFHPANRLAYPTFLPL